MISGGLKARIACLDPRVMPREFAGREFDAALLAELPAGIDPCGENGEFHTFACGGPMFAGPIAVALGSVAEREGFVFQDILPAGA
jgi:diphthamide synthase (EF-2-diphthine--ammonia ligase)